MFLNGNPTIFGHFDMGRNTLEVYKDKNETWWKITLYIQLFFARPNEVM